MLAGGHQAGGRETDNRQKNLRMKSCFSFSVDTYLVLIAPTVKLNLDVFLILIYTHMLSIFSYSLIPCVLPIKTKVAMIAPAILDLS